LKTAVTNTLANKATTLATTYMRLSKIKDFAPPILEAKRAGIANIHTLATDFITAPTQPPAKGPKTPTSGALISKLSREASKPNRSQHRTHGTATKSTRINQGVANKGGKTCMTTERAARTAAPAILTAGFLTE